MEGRYALIVANGGYRDPKLSRLRSPATDASELARVLNDAEIGAFDVELSTDEPEHVLRRRVARFFADRKRDDLLLLHFSCHGLKDDSGQLYFAAADTEVDHLEATAISAEFVSRQMTRSRSRKVVALLDCCYSGAIARGLQFRAGAEVDVEDHLGGHGRVVITASSAMEYAFEGDELSGEGKPSVFTTAVVRGLESGEADRDQDRLISVDDLYDYVCEQVREVTPHQRPNMLSHLEGALYIARSSYVAPVTPAPLPAPLVAAIDNPLAGVRAGAVGELRGLLEHGDPGTVAAARAALTTLAGDDSRRVGAAAAEALGSAAPTTGPHLVAATAVEPTTVEPRDEPVAARLDEAVAEPRDEAVAGPEAKPIVEVPAEPVAELQDEPAFEPQDEPVAELQDEPAFEPQDEPVAAAPAQSTDPQPAEPVAKRAPKRALARKRPADTGRAGGLAPVAALVLPVLGGLGVIVMAMFAWKVPYIGWCEIALLLFGLVATAAAVARHVPSGATRRPALSALIILAGGFALGAATGVTSLEPVFGEGATEGPVMIGGAAVLLGGVLGLGRQPQGDAPRWAAAVAIPAAALPLLGALLPWLYDATMHEQVKAPLEGAIWLATVVGCLCAVAYTIPGLRSPLAPAVPLLAAGSFLLGASVLLYNLFTNYDYPAQAGFWLMAAGAAATTIVATVLTTRDRRE